MFSPQKNPQTLRVWGIENPRFSKVFIFFVVQKIKAFENLSKFIISLQRKIQDFSHVSIFTASNQRFDLTDLLQP
jgi:hypothetical protein